MQGSVYVVILLACAAGCTFADPGSGPAKFQRVMTEFSRMLETNATWRAEFERAVAENDNNSLSFNFTFNCQVNTTQATPRTVHELRPQDINVIAALGDSITAGNGVKASWIGEVLWERWGQSWSIGGDGSLEDDVHTIANVMRKFNENITGYSAGYGTFLWNGKTGTKLLNVAIPGSKAEDIPGQAKKLIEKMENDPHIDFKKDWKLITLLIGGNDLCDYCENEDKYSPENYKRYIKIALDLLSEKVPRALVNLVAMADVSPIPHIRKEEYCIITRWVLCNCALNKTGQPDLKPIQQGYHDALSELAWEYDKDDFTVVLQPHLLHQEFPKYIDGKDYDPSYFAPDCFHPNWKTHQALSFFYWDTMLTPVGQKPLSREWDLSMNTTYKCPTEDAPYIFTNYNSGNITKPTTTSTTSSTTPTTVSSTSSITTTTQGSTSTTDGSGSSAPNQFACSMYGTVLKRVFLYGSLLAILWY